MESKRTNLLISTFAGLSLPSTISIPVPRTIPISDVFDTLTDVLPIITSRLILSTASGTILSRTSSAPISSLAGGDGQLLSLRLHAPLPGGKGGFGSQLRAAGGRMSSRKRKGQENNDSCRNLDGRRMRTVKEVKALAAYLEIKSDMDKKEKERRRERWQKVLDNADEGIKAGGKKANTRFDDVEWLDQKEEDMNKTREAVVKMMKLNGGKVPEVKGKSDPSGSSSSEEISGLEDAGEGSSEGSGSDDDNVIPARSKKARPVYFGFDDEDAEFMSSSDAEEEEDDDEEDEEDDEDESGLADIPEAQEDADDTPVKGKEKAT